MIVISPINKIIFFIIIALIFVVSIRKELK
ncbi:MAG: hypothetical protein K0R07_1908 [Sedimentibacter sp.]|jgi:hypothetical protein|nr:hypothetical protein [Sedimentibacter sp.]